MVVEPDVRTTEAVLQICSFFVPSLRFGVQGLKTLSYCMIGTSALCLVAVQLVTGRMHQIRDWEARSCQNQKLLQRGPSQTATLEFHQNLTL